MSKLISVLFLFLTCALYAQGDVVGKGGWKMVAIGYPAETLSNSTAAEQDYTTALYTIPANYLQAGKAIRITLGFEFATGVSTVTFDQYIEANGVKIFNTGSSSDLTNSSTLTNLITVVITGTSAAASSANVEIYAGVTGGYTGVNMLGITNQPVALATDGTLPLTAGIQYSGTGSTESSTLRLYWVEQLN